MRKSLVLSSAGLLLAAALAAPGQQPAKPAPAAVFRTTTNLVILGVFVRDSSGREIPNLAREDFTVIEDGKPQTIAVFESEQLDSAAVNAPAATVTPPAVPSEHAVTSSVSSVTGRYGDRRLLVLFFDFSSMPPADQARARKAALKFIDEQMSPADMVSIMTFSTELKVEQDFTDDRDRLRDAIKSFRLGEGADLAAEGATSDDESAEDTQAAFTADESEFNIFNTDRKLAALESAAKMLAGLPQKKALIYFSSGVGKTGVENQSQLTSTVAEATRANVSFYPIDARGLTAIVPGGDASKAAPGGAGLFSGNAQRTQLGRFHDQQETLVTLASDTGGKALLDSNDLSAGIVQAQKDIRSYYIIGYYTSNPAPDGRFRRVQIRLNPKLQARLDYRSGYFAAKDFSRFTESDREKQLQEALMLGDPVTDLPLALEVNYFRVSRSTYFVPVAVKVPGSEIVLAKKGSEQFTELDFIGQVRDDKGRLAGTVRDGIKVKLGEADVAKLEHKSLQYDTGFTLAPGKYKLRFLARENQTGKMGTFETAFEVPDLNTVGDRLRTSSVVLGNQREPIREAVGSASENKKLLAQNPLVENDQKLIPSITRVFRKNQRLYVYMEVYDPATGAGDRQPNVLSGVSFLRGRSKAFESAPVRLTAAPKSRGALPLEFEVPLETLAPGKYTLQVNAVDEVGRKFAFARAPIVILP